MLVNFPYYQKWDCKLILLVLSSFTYTYLFILFHLNLSVSSPHTFMTVTLNTVITKDFAVNLLLFRVVCHVIVNTYTFFDICELNAILFDPF